MPKFINFLNFCRRAIFKGSLFHGYSFFICLFVGGDFELQKFKSEFHFLADVINSHPNKTKTQIMKI